MMASLARSVGDINLPGRDLGGAPSRARTCDLLIRSQTLYPTELRVHATDGATKGHKSKIYLPWKCVRTYFTMSLISACDILSLKAGIASSPFVIILAI